MSSKPYPHCAKLIYVTITITILFQTFMNCVNSVSISNNDHEVRNLHGQPAVNFKQFASYITVDEAKQ